MKLKKPVFQSQECLKKDEILLYLEGKSDDDTRYRVENHLLDCSLCAAAIEGFTNNTTDDLAYDFELLQDAIKVRSARSEKDQTTKIRDIWTFNRIAVAILLMIIPAAGIFYWNAQNSASNAMAFSYPAAEMIDGLRSSELLGESNEYQEGLKLFRAEEFDKTLVYFENILEARPENSFAKFYSGLCALQLGETEKAIENLSVVRFNDETYYEHASFYLAIAHIKQGNKREAEYLIEDLLKIEGGFYSDKAKKILKEIQ